MIHEYQEAQLDVLLQALKLYIKTEIDPLNLLSACTMHKDIVEWKTKGGHELIMRFEYESKA